MPSIDERSLIVASRTIRHGSFCVSTLLAPKSVNRFVATAANLKTGETGAIKATL
jgi:hypothetical protein